MNFNQRMLDRAENPALDEYRKNKVAIDPNLPPTLNKLLYMGSPFTPENEKIIKERIQDMKDKFDLPFDEMYHKEKKLVD